MMSMVRIHQFSADAPDLVSPSATHTCGWLTHGRLLFFACAKKSNQKKHTPERATASSVPRPTGRSPTRRPHNTRLDSNRGSLKNSRWGCGTRRALRGGEHPTSVPGMGVLFHPVWRARASQPESGYSRASCSSPSRVLCGRRVEARADSGEKRREFSRHPGALSFGYFSLREQRKVPRSRCENRKYTRGRRPLDSCARH
jgi:hypothetical protein